MTDTEKILNAVNTLTNEVGRLRSVVEANSVDLIDGDTLAKLLGKTNSRFVKPFREDGTLKKGVDFWWNGSKFMYLRKTSDKLKPLMFS